MALIDDVRKPRTENTTPLMQALAKPNSYGDAAAASANPGVAQLPAPGLLGAQARGGASAADRLASIPAATQLPAPGLLAQQPPAAPAKPTFFPGNSPDAVADIYAGAGFGKSQPAPPAAPAPPDLAAQIPGQSARAPAPDGSQADAWNTDLGRNVRNTAMAIPGVSGVGGIAATGGLISSSLSALAQGARVAGGAAGINAAQDVARQQPANTGYNFPATAGAGRGSVNPPMAEPNAPRPTVAPPDNPNNITRVGNSYSGGPNISGDFTVNGKEPGGGFMVAPGQTYPAPGLMRQTATQQLATAPQVQHSGNSFAARKALENAATSASSITNNGSGWDQHRGISPARSAYAAMLKNDLAMQGAQPGVDVAAMKENAATGRAAMQEDGNNARFGQSQGIALSRLAMEKETQGIANRGASLVESMRAQIAQEPDTTKRQPLVQRLRELQGGQTADPYLVVPGGQGLTRDEKPYTMPSAVFNRQTQQWVQQPAQPSANHLAALLANPKQAADFDAKYGAGAARRAMGG